MKQLQGCDYSVVRSILSLCLGYIIIVALFINIPGAVERLVLQSKRLIQTWALVTQGSKRYVKYDTQNLFKICVHELHSVHKKLYFTFNDKHSALINWTMYGVKNSRKIKNRVTQCSQCYRYLPNWSVQYYVAHRVIPTQQTRARLCKDHHMQNLLLPTIKANKRNKNWNFNCT